MRLDNQNAMMDDFHARIRARDWYHDLSEQESDEEIQQIVARAEGQEANGMRINQERRIVPLSGAEQEITRPNAEYTRMNPRPPQALQPQDETTVSNASMQQGMQRLYASYQQCVTRVAQVDDRLEQFRQAIRQDALEIALTVQRVRQDLQNQGQGMEQIRHTLYDLVQEKVDTLESRFQKFDEFTHSVMGTVDKNAHELCSTVAKIIDEQADIRRIVEELARRMDHAQEESAVETREGPSVAVQLEVNDLKAKVLRLTEQVTEHTAKVNFFSVMSEKVDLMEQQIHRWRYRLPDLTDDESREPVVSAVEVQEALDKFKDLTMIKVRKIREDLHSLDREVQFLERVVVTHGKRSVTTEHYGR